MRKTLKNTLVVVLALVGAAACSADVGERSDTLRAIDEQAMTSQLLYMRLDLSPFPMTAADLDASGTDATLAIPVRIEIFDEIAVAWFAPGGAARVNSDGIIAVWTVENRVPIDGELNNAEIGVVVPGGAGIFLTNPHLSATTAPARPDTEQVTTAIPIDERVRTIVDFFDVLNSIDHAAIVAQLGGFHPGCL